MKKIHSRRAIRVIAMILGGGQGKRLYPLTMYRSKPAVPIGGKFRLIDIPISNCLHSGIKDIYVLTQFNSESLNNHVNNTYRFDYFSRAFVRILAAEQTLTSADWFEGTADAVRKNLFHLDLKGDEEILILSGDHLYDMNYGEFIDFHRKSGADFTVSVISVRHDQAGELGMLKLDRDGRITGFKEKPKRESELKNFRMPDGKYPASMGVYIFNAAALEKALKGNAADFGKEVIPNSINKLKGYGYVFNGYWRDVGTIKCFYDTSMAMASSREEFSFMFEGSVFTRPRFLPSARILNCKVSRSIIAEGSVINDADISNSVIGLRSIIGKGCKVTRTVVMGADYYEPSSARESIKMGIGDGSRVDRAIVDKNARIGRNVLIRNLKGRENYDGENYFIRDGIVIIPKNARIRNGTRI